MKIKCSHDLYDGDVVADKWYEVTNDFGSVVAFRNENSLEIWCRPNGNCAHLDDVPGAFWAVSNDD